MLVKIPATFLTPAHYAADIRRREQVTGSPSLPPRLLAVLGCFRSKLSPKIL